MKVDVRFAGVASAFAIALSLAAGCNNNHVLGLPGNLIAQPSSLDFGRVREQQDQGLVVMLKNNGSSPIHVTGLELQPANAPYHLNVTLPTASAPWVINAGSFAPVDVHFIPQVQGDAAAQIVVHSTDPDSPEIDVPIAGHGFYTQTDSFTQGTTIGGKADILFMVDNSGSMSDKQQKVAASFSTFINWLIGKNVDYHIAVTTTDMDDPTQSGRFLGSPKIIDTTTPNVVAAFQHNVNVGDTGSGTERGFAAALASVSAPLATADNAGFLRADAKLFVVYVSDEDDQSTGSPTDQINGIRAAKGGDASKVFFAAIAGPTPFGCSTLTTSAETAPRYKAVIDATTGLFGSICDNDFGTTLQNLAFQVTAAQGTFVLTQMPDPGTIHVIVDGVDSPEGHWQYDITTNSISFVDPWVPAGNIPVVISYDVL
ncbi:MAG TPA: hypothetical protein VMV18_06625 [bacterium]|nr:hypothetical protein [bacterium]